MGTYVPGTEPWAGWSGVVLGSLSPEVSLPIFTQHRWVWDFPFYFCASPHLSASLTPLDECDFFNTLVAGLPNINFLMILSDICFIV